MPLLKKNSPDALEVTVTNRTVIRVILLVLSAVLLLLAIRQAAHALTLIFISFFLALALNAPVHWISSKIPGKRKGNRTLATAFSFLIVVVLLGLFLASIIPPLIR